MSEIDIVGPAVPESDRQLMELAISLARNSTKEGEKITPKVGAVVARDGRSLGGAFRGELAPGEHAEFTLLEKKRNVSTTLRQIAA